MGILQNINSPEDVRRLDMSRLTPLAAEIREFLIQSVAKTGGHLASNLGVVELTLALHRVFDTSRDKIVWDVGHQIYTHKIITGRKDAFDRLRGFGGISGFPKCAESAHDCFNTGHSSTSISAALGIAAARDLQGKKHAVVAVIGDGALSGGLAYEGLNNAGRLKSNFIVVLNDNEMSISQNVGSMSRYLNKIRTDPAYFKAKKEVEALLTKIPRVGGAISQTLQKAKDSIRYLLVHGTLFEELGFRYFGPIDGHDIPQMIEVLSRAKSVDAPVLLHIYTKKGKGYSFAEEEPHAFHGIGSFDVATGRQRCGAGDRIPSSAVVGEALCEMAKINKKITAITAAMPDGTGLSAFSRLYPNRFFDVGIAEQHAVTFAAGLASAGMVPVAAVYSTFLQRGYDQISHDVALQNLHVVFCVDRSGVVGEDGETHHGIYDLSYLSHIPGMAILAPAGPRCLREMLDYAVNAHTGPIAIRYHKSMPVCDDAPPFAFGKAEVLQRGDAVTLVSVGNMLETALCAAKMSGADVEVIDLRTVLPLDTATLTESLNKTGKMIVLEDNAVNGGAGTLVETALGRAVTKLGHTAAPPHGGFGQLYKLCGLDAETVAEVIKRETAT
ncbi:1-deoxy-D-xylulose-5-phosphate synthase 1 [Clostridia bacterium]|nr:1-deoxy-D-xylulose-5-phosphate synthase 1 [Clostridia bacterium]